MKEKKGQVKQERLARERAPVTRSKAFGTKPSACTIGDNTNGNASDYFSFRV
jgi:hypothetical protein